MRVMSNLYRAILHSLGKGLSIHAKAPARLRQTHQKQFSPFKTWGIDREGSGYLIKQDA
jgi:hypothetical protein